jgi:adenylate cyclase
MFRLPIGSQNLLSGVLRQLVRWSYAMTVASAVAAIVVVGLVKTWAPIDLSNLVFDAYQRFDHRSWNPNQAVRIIDINDESLARIGQWPWPRSTIADIVSKLRDLGASAVVMDIVFAEPDGRSPEQLVTLLPASPGRILLQAEIQDRTTNDAALAKALTQMPTVLGTVLTPDAPTGNFPDKTGLAIAGDDPLPFLAHFTGAILPLPVLSEASQGVGALNWLPDRDQIVRRVPLIFGIGDRIVPSLALETLRVAQGASTLIVRSSNASGETAFGAQTGVNTIKVGNLEIPTDAQGALRVHATRSEPRRFIPAWKLLADDVARGEVEGRIVLVGTTAAGLRDERSTPVETSVAGSEIQAQVIEQVLAATWLRRPDWAPGVELALAAGLALGFGGLLPRVGALAGALGGAAAVALVIYASRYEFTANGLLVDPTLPGVAILITYVLCLMWLYSTEQRRRKFVREAFAHYVSPAVIERLAEDPVRLVLGGEARTLTIMFCDVRGFTAMAERLDARSLTQFMNEFLTSMSEAVLTHGGTIDKYIGDAVMAFWNAPLDDPHHARHAAQAALAMMSELDGLNATWKARAEARGEEHHEVRFGIGLATGESYVGNFGSSHRFDYSALGDCVNLASRLETATKLYRTSTLASEVTRDASPDLPWLEVDSVRVLGKREVTKVFTLVSSGIDAGSEAFVALAAVHERMLAAYRNGDFAAAVFLAKQGAAAAPASLHGLYEFYEQRCGSLAQSCPTGWAPVIDFDDK